MSNNKGGSRAGMGQGDVLLIIFIVLKLCGVISWSWVWVLSPLWITVGIALLVLGCAYIMGEIYDSK